jgi:uncharacterized RDD family membrane protein YckC
MLLLFLRRSVAYLTDSLLILIFIRPAQLTQRFVGELHPLTWFGLQLVAIVITAFYVVGSHARWGCTLGKAMCGLRVAALDVSIPPALKNAFFRAVPVVVIGNLDLIVATFGPDSWRADLFSRGRWHANLWQMFALLWICLDIGAALLTGARRSLHDMIGSTLVTRKA